MLSEKDLDQKGEMKKFINKTSIKIELGGQKGEFSHPTVIAEPKRK